MVINRRAFLGIATLAAAKAFVEGASPPALGERARLWRAALTDPNSEIVPTEANNKFQRYVGLRLVPQPQPGGGQVNESNLEIRGDGTLVARGYDKKMRLTEIRLKPEERKALAAALGQRFEASLLDLENARVSDPSGADFKAMALGKAAILAAGDSVPRGTWESLSRMSVDEIARLYTSLKK